ncbi:putative MFS transporter [Trichoderma afarasin]
MSANDSASPDAPEKAEVLSQHQAEVNSGVLEKSGEPTPDDGEDLDGEAPEYATGVRLILIMCSIFLATLVAAIDLGIVATAIPGITSDFHKLDDIGWYGGTIFITVGITSPLNGKLYKYFSARWVYLGCVLLYLIGSAIAAPAPNSIALIVGRAIQGWGVAGVLGGSVLMITYVAEPKARPILIGLWTCVLMVSTILGPIVGGAFTSGVNWRWCFWINLPIGCPIIVLILLFFHIPKHVKPTPATWKEIVMQLDLGGFVLLLASLVCFTLAMQWGGQTKAWSDGSVIAVLVVWLVLTIGFVLLEWFLGAYAMIPLRNLKPRLFWTNALYGWLVNLAEFLALFYLPIYFQSIHGQSAITSGVNTIPFVAFFALGSLVSGFLVSKTGYLQPLQLVSGLLATVGGALLYILDVDSGKAKYIGPQVILGFGIGLGNQIPMTVYQFFSPPDQLQSNTGVMLMTNGMSGAFFVTAAQNVFSNRMLQRLAQLAPQISSQQVLATGASDFQSVFHGADLLAVRQAYMTGIKDVFAFAMAGAALTAVLPLIIPRNRLPGFDKKEADKESNDSSESNEPNESNDTKSSS